MPWKQITLGNVSITRVWEYFGSVEMTSDIFFPESSKEVWESVSGWLVPHFLDSGTNIVNSANQTWLLRSEDKTILVDTGVGNHKERPYTPVWSRLETDLLANLARAGVQPEDVDIVINTHLHIDHVGWNTYLDGQTWVPTFPHATYLMPKADRDGQLGATHAVELPFVFDLADRPELNGPAALLGPEQAPADLAARVHATWIRFARTGDPGWDPYDTDRRATMRIDAEWSQTDDPRSKEREVWS
ncbi:MBL fold metallo-hydrolase [Streptomyces anthocyanicus]